MAKKNVCARKPVARICRWNSSESNEADEINDAKMIVGQVAKILAPPRRYAIKVSNVLVDISIILPAVNLDIAFISQFISTNF